MPALSMGCQMNNYMEWVSTYVKLEVLGMFINTLSSSNFDFDRLWSSGCDYPLEYLPLTCRVHANLQNIQKISRLGTAGD